MQVKLCDLCLSALEIVTMTLHSVHNKPQKYTTAVNEFTHSFTCKLHHACLYSGATEHHRPWAGTHFTIPWRVEG